MKLFVHGFAHIRNSLIMKKKLEAGSYRYNRLGNFYYQFGIRENSFCTLIDQHAWPNKPTPLSNAWSMALSAMMVKCEVFIYLLN